MKAAGMGNEVGDGHQEQAPASLKCLGRPLKAARRSMQSQFCLGANTGPDYVLQNGSAAPDLQATLFRRPFAPI